ncbi:MAG: hypothetical protein IAE67_02905 [Candidatus Competibacteraceae bacterium]|nr:hypothetical protein [Candidatus Competibacteraceae bacterium]
MNLRISILIIIFNPFLCEAQVNKYANAFLDIGIGARSLGMSNAVSASLEDVSCGYWNPAGLPYMQRDIQVGFMHNEHFAGIVKFDYGGVAVKFNEKSAGAFTFIRSGVDDIPNTLELVDANGNVDYDRVKSFSAADYAFMLSYARTIPKVKGLSYGGTLKVIYRHIGEFGSGWGFGFDFGARYKLKTWTFAATLRDATSTITNFSYNTEKFRLVFTATGNEVISSSTEIAVPKLVLATSKHFNLPKKFRILTEIDIAMTTDGRRNVLIPAGPVSFDPCAGVEFEYNDLVFIRAGVGRFQYLKDPEGGKNLTALPTIGLGFKYWGISVDYTLANFGNSIVGMSHVFSLRVDFNKKKKDDAPEAKP